MKKFVLLMLLVGGWYYYSQNMVGGPRKRTGGGLFKWTNDLEYARRKAKSEGKYVLINFTGSTWCGWCKALSKEVFNTKDFKGFAAANLVCVEFDFPRGKTTYSKQLEYQETLAQKYQVSGFPTILLLSPTGKLVKRTGYQKGGADNYIKMLEKSMPAVTPQRTSKSKSKDKPGERSFVSTIVGYLFGLVFG